jgi:hypothetical protein
MKHQGFLRFLEWNFYHHVLLGLEIQITVHLTVFFVENPSETGFVKQNLENKTALGYMELSKSKLEVHRKELQENQY